MPKILPKNDQTNSVFCQTVLKTNSFICFLEEFEDTKKSFRNKLTYNRYLKCAKDVLPIWPRPLYITATAIGTEFRSMKYLLRTFFPENCTYSTMWWYPLEESILMLCPSMWPKQFSSVQNGFGLTKLIWTWP